MRFHNICKMIIIICALSLSLPLFAQESDRKHEILNIVKRTPSPGSRDVTPYVKQLSQSDVPLIYDLVLDKTVEFEFRRVLSLSAAKLNPDKTQINRITQNAIKLLPESKLGNSAGSMVGPLLQGIEALYKTTKDDGIIVPFRKLYEDSICTEYCKRFLIELLNDTGSPQNISLYNKILNRPGSAAWEKEMATYGLAKSGSVESIPLLREMANTILDPKDDPGKYGAYLTAVRVLGTLCEKHYEACKEIQEVITNVCGANEYGYLMKNSANVQDLFSGLKNNEGNRKYLENLLGNECKYKDGKQHAIKMLGTIGNRETIDSLMLYEGLYPDTVKNAIKGIQKRITKSER
jgi:hypothetical protein